MVIERRDFIPLLRDDPEVAIRLINILCARLRRTSEQVEDIVFLGLPNRLAKVLLHLYQPSPTALPNTKIHVTQREISQMIGVSRESANKQLQDWQRRKWLKLERGGVVIFSPDALRDLVSWRGCRITTKLPYSSIDKCERPGDGFQRFAFGIDAPAPGDAARNNHQHCTEQIACKYACARTCVDKRAKQ